MARAEIRIGFEPEDRELIERMLESQERDLDAANTAVDEARARGMEAYQRRRDAEFRLGLQSTVLRQLETRLRAVGEILKDESTSDAEKIDLIRELA